MQKPQPLGSRLGKIEDSDVLFQRCIRELHPAAKRGPVVEGKKHGLSPARHANKTIHLVFRLGNGHFEWLSVFVPPGHAPPPKVCKVFKANDISLDFGLDCGSNKKIRRQAGIRRCLLLGHQACQEVHGQIYIF